MNISGNNALRWKGIKTHDWLTTALSTSDVGHDRHGHDRDATGQRRDGDAVIENNGAINIYANNSFALACWVP